MHLTNCIESDAHRDAARAVEMLHAQLMAAVVDPYAWKWVLLVLHNTLQSIAASVLEETDASTVVEGTVGPLRVHRDMQRRPRPGGGDDLSHLFARLKQVGGIQTPEEVDRDIARLSRYRDVFVSDLPTRWELEFHGLPQIVRNGLRILDQLGWTASPTLGRARGLSASARAKLVASIHVLDALDRQYRA